MCMLLTPVILFSVLHAYCYPVFDEPLTIYPALNVLLLHQVLAGKLLEQWGAVCQ